MLLDDPIANVLYIDLNRKKYEIRRREDLFSKYIGGTGVATQLLLEECPKGTDPLGKHNPIIFAISPLTSLFPIVSKTVAMFKSPHTNDLGESHSGGRSAISIRMAGFGAIVINGASDEPIYLAIHEDKIYFRDASTLWGMGSNFTVGRIIKENEPNPGIRSIMRIGKGGENLISYACVITESYRHFGRLGLGAVFGSKKLKALVISGKKSIPISDIRAYKKLYNNIYKTITESSVMKKYHEIGTPINVNPLNEMGALPSHNLKYTRNDKAHNISGERFAKDYLGRRIACAHCPIGCIHIAALRIPYENKPYFYKTSMIAYDYEPIYSLGAMVGIYNPEDYLKLMDEVEVLCVDAMSMGVILSWAIEAYEKGIITDKETMGIEFKWGDVKQLINAVKLVVKQPNKFYKALAKGVDFASSQFGGKDFALSFGKNEMAGYHTGPATHIGALIGARHGHLDNAGYSIDQKILTKKAASPKEVVDLLLLEEELRQVLSSISICFFARGVYNLELISEALKISDFNFSVKELNDIGKKIHREKYKFKLREGFDFKNLKLPKRIFETTTPVGDLDREYIQDAIDYAKDVIMGDLECD